jgi:hypothetical protein
MLIDGTRVVNNKAALSSAVTFNGRILVFTEFP